MYMHISSTTSLRRGRSIDCYLNDCCCNHFLQQQTPTSTGIHSFSPCLKVSCGLRQSALICSSRYRRVVGNNGCHIQKKRAGVIYPGQDRICRCLGWGEEKEEEEEEEACIGGLQGYEPSGEVQEMLSFLIEDRRRRAQGSKRREILRSSEVSGTVSGLGVVWKEKSCYAKRTIGGRVGKQTSCSAEKENAGKGFEQLEFEDKWDKFTGFAQKENVKKEPLLCEKGTCQKSCLDTSLNGWKNRLNWISALESKNRRLNWICALELEKQEGSFENGAERTALGKRWNQLDSGVRWSSTVYPEKREETTKKSTEKFGSDTSLNSSSRSTKRLQETVGNETEKIGPRKMLDGLRRNVQCISAVKFQKQEETVQESTQKSGFELPSNNSKNMRQVSMSHSGKDETSSLEKGQSSGVGSGLGEHSREHLDQMVRQETVENTTEKLVFKPDKLDLMEQTLQKERGKLVSSLSSDHSRNTARWSSDPEFAKRETVENTTKTLVFRQQDELDSRKKSAQILQKERGELAPGMLSNYSSEIAGLSSLTKLKEQERVESTTKKLVFPQQDDFISKNGRSSSAKLEEERGTTEENAKTASERSGFLAISNSNSQKVFKESSHISGSSNVLSSGIELDKKISNVDYEKGNKTSQRLFKTSSSKPVYGEASALVAEKNKSTTSSGKADNTSENMLQTSSYTLVRNGILSSASEVEKMRSTSDHKTSSKISQFSGDLRSKSSSNEILGMTTELEKNKYTTDTNTQAMFGKSASGKLSDESECSLEMFSAEGTENHGLNEKISEESPPQAHNSQLLSGNLAAEGPSEEVWAIAGCSSREVSKELHSSGNEKEERGSETLTSEEPSDNLQKNIAGLEEGNSTASKSDGKIIVGRHSRGLWSSIAELCSKGWSSHVDSENSTMKSGSGRPSTESPDSEEWFSVPELEDEEYTSKEKKGKDKKKISAKRQVDAVISSTGPSKTVDLKETESPQAKKADKPIKKSTSESSLDYSQLTRRRVSSAGNGHERQIRGKGGRLVAIADTKKTEGTKQVEVQKAAIQWVSEGSLEDELAVSIGRVPSGSHEEHDCLERGKGEISLVNKDEIEEHDDIQELVQSSEIEEKEKMTSKLKLTNQVPKETFILWEEALILQSEQRQEDEKFMREALSEARMAADAWEVPVGAVLVQNGRIIARAHNLVEENRDATAHAEMLCIRYASNQLKTWRLAESTLYVTLEPCAMCAGAILQARVGTVVWGAPNKLLGADGSWISLFPRADEERLHGTDGGPPSTAPVHPFHPNIRVRRGVLASECSNVMQQFFKLRRKSEKKTESHSRFSLTNCQSKLFAKLHDMFSIFCL